MIINNYNYEKFLYECVLSVLNQTLKIFQLIVVDDGSQDGSVDVINKINDPRITLIKKSNGGQLSCFNAAFPHIKGDIVFFLDSDDVFCNKYLEKISSLYEEKDVDFIFANYNIFGSVERKCIMPTQDFIFPDTTLLTFFSKCWIGGPTSTLSMKTSLLKKILPLYELENAWKTRADDILIWGASLHGAKKYYCHEALVNYRAHGNNNYYGSELTIEEIREREINISHYFSNFLNLRNNLTLRDIISEYKTSLLPLRYYLPLMADSCIAKKIVEKLINVFFSKDDDYKKIIL